jgi:glycosyltransferase involved in cell wall biosynthesis
MINLLSSSSGGALSYIRNLIPLLARAFAESGQHQLVLLLHEHQKSELPELDAATQYVQVAPPRNGYLRVLWEMRTLPRIVAERAVDVLFTPYQLAPAVRGIRTVAMIRNMEPFLFGKYRYDLKNYIRNTVLCRASSKTLRNADRVIAVSQFAARYCRESLGLPDSRLNTIYHGRDQRFSAQAEPGDDAMLAGLGVTGDYLFTCGSMLPYRRCELIIDAFANWSGRPDCQLIIAGTSTDSRYQAGIRAAIERSGAAGSIKWLGQVKPDAMRVLYRRSRLFVTATEIEACPNIGIEALSSGCHIVSSDNEPLPEIFADAALYYRADDSGELTRLMAQQFSAAAGSSEKARARAEFFSWEACSRHTFKALVDWDSH